MARKRRDEHNRRTEKWLMQMKLGQTLDSMEGLKINHSDEENTPRAASASASTSNSATPSEISGSFDELKRKVQMVTPNHRTSAKSLKKKLTKEERRRIKKHISSMPRSKLLPGLESNIVAEIRSVRESFEQIELKFSEYQLHGNCDNGLENDVAAHKHKWKSHCRLLSKLRNLKSIINDMTDILDKPMGRRNIDSSSQSTNNSSEVNRPVVLQSPILRHHAGQESDQMNQLR